ncbi:myelin-associated glycoprotein isoform X2 [Echeneis naucrates]|uniref:myelin-associated glycoprotein isoform X2 n=1 Tax=Echeneis naucrates TaxID=173247 RepID=UPI00111411FA|nr:myelin-associated glycoprotein-like isoform X2 [Echeneis naucrates]
MEGFENYSFKANSVSISVIDKPSVALSMKKDMAVGQTTVASCSVSPFCPTSPPVFEWSHSGEARLQSQQFIDGQWKTTVTLNFLPSHTDHNKPLLCTVRFEGGVEFETSRVLKVKYAPVDVKVQYKSEVKEGEAVRLKCSSDAYPQASSYEWHLKNGTLLHRGNVYTEANVSRHMSAIYCTAINTKGRSRSRFVELNVLYAPEIKNVSSCSSEKDKVTCICIVESKPPCMIHFALMGRVLSGTTVETHGSVTIGTHSGEFGSSEFVHCLANNTVGYANHTLSLPVNGKMEYLYIAIAIGAVVALVVILAAVGLVQKGRKTGDMPPHHTSPTAANKAEELPQYAVAEGKEMDYENLQSPGFYDDDHVYSNMETDLDEAVYANMQYR